MEKTNFYDIHDSERKLECQLNRAKELKGKNSKLILEFIKRYGLMKQLSIQRKIKLLSMLYVIATHTTKNLDGLNYQDIEDFILSKQEEKLSSWTIRGYIDFFKLWLKYLDEKKNFDLIKKINELKPRKYNKVTSEDLITPEEKIKLFSACDKQEITLLSLLFSGGLRLGEATNNTIDSVKFDSDNEAFDFHVRQGKTESSKRQVRISDSFTVNCMKEWLSIHPQRTNLKAPLFISKEGRAFSYNSLRQHLKRIVKRAGLTDKRIHFHLARHTRATELYEHLPSQVSKHVLGHSPSSKMEAFYSHLNYNSVKEQIDEMNGKKEPKKKQDQKKYCLKCLKPYEDQTKMFCDACGSPLEESMVQIKTKNEEITKLKNEMESIRELLQELITKK